jgi:hypothetical protein
MPTQLIFKSKAMKKLLIVLGSILILQACSNNGGQSGAVNDGISPVDSNGALADTPYTTNQSATDTSKMEDRVETSKRDTFDHK